MRSAMSEKRLAVWVSTNKKAPFDGAKIQPWPPTLLVYDVAGPKDPIVIRMKPVDGQFDFAFSPSGTKLAVFDNARVQIYSFD